MISTGVWAWGRNDFGQLAQTDSDHRSVPMPIEGLDDVDRVFAGGHTALARRADGTFAGWGRNDANMLCVNLREPGPILTDIFGLDDVVAAACGISNAYVITCLLYTSDAADE